jgi:hypothetical protein
MLVSCSLQRSLAKARVEQVDPAIEERRRRRLHQKSLEEKQNDGGEASPSPKKKAPKKMSHSVRENTLDLGLHPTAPISNRLADHPSHLVYRVLSRCV